MDISVYSEIENRLFQKIILDIYEQRLYYYLISQTHLKNIESETIPLSQISKALRISDWQSRKSIRRLKEVGCIDLDQTRAGHQVTVHLPSKILGASQMPIEEDIDIYAVDFYKGRRFIDALLEREDHKCFYCFTNVSRDDAELDHLVAQVNGGDNSFKNIVVACHKCNTQKSGKDAMDHLRDILRRNLINESEFNDRILAVDQLQQGNIIPQI